MTHNPIPKLALTLVPVAVVAMTTGLPSSAAPATAQQTRPDVFLWVWDATRADHLPMYGYERDTTPAVARFSENATIFENCQASGSWTIPSLASLFTGMFGHNHGVDYAVTDHSVNPPDKVVMLAEAFKAAGYTTGLFTAQDVYFRDAFLQGFDVAEKAAGSPVGAKGIEFAKSAGDTPAFIVMWELNPHAPYTPGTRDDIWSEQPAPDVNIKVLEPDFPDKPRWLHHLAVNSGKETFTEAEWQRIEDLYDGELRMNDVRFGNWLKRIDAMGLADTSVIALTSDHGEGLNDRAEQRTWHLWPAVENQHVPLIIRTPGQKGTQRVSTAVRGIDLYPTLLELAGAPVDQPINGESMVPLLNGTAGRDRPNMGFSHYGNGLAFYSDAHNRLIWRRGERGGEYLYDVQNDPKETNNLAKTDAKLLAEVKERAETFQLRTTISIEGAGEATMSQEEYEKLKALGYVE